MDIIFLHYSSKWPRSMLSVQGCVSLQRHMVREMQQSQITERHENTTWRGTRNILIYISYTYTFADKRPCKIRTRLFNDLQVFNHVSETKWDCLLNAILSSSSGMFQ